MQSVAALSVLRAKRRRRALMEKKPPRTIDHALCVKNSDGQCRCYNAGRQAGYAKGYKDGVIKNIFSKETRKAIRRQVLKHAP